jgi:hypothetical protein
MENEHEAVKSVNRDMEHVLNDARHFLQDLKGQKKQKGMVKSDVQHLKDHLQKLLDDLDALDGAVNT